MPPPLSLFTLPVSAARAATAAWRKWAKGGKGGSGGPDDDDDDDEEEGWRYKTGGNNRVGPANPTVSQGPRLVAVGKTVVGPDRWRVDTKVLEEPQMADRTLFSFREGERVEGSARARLLRRLDREASQGVAGAHDGAIRTVERRLCELQNEITLERADLSRTLESMRKQKLLDVLPAFTKDASNEADLIVEQQSRGYRSPTKGGTGLSKVQHDVHLGFGEALAEAVRPLLTKVDGVESRMKELHKKVSAAAATAQSPVQACCTAEAARATGKGVRKVCRIALVAMGECGRGRT